MLTLTLMQRSAVSHFLVAQLLKRLMTCYGGILQARLMLLWVWNEYAYDVTMVGLKKKIYCLRLGQAHWVL